MSALPPKSPAAAPPFSDAFGYRVLGFDKKSGDRLEMLRLRPQLASSAPFEAALRERQRRLSDFRHPAFARVRQIDRPAGQAAALAIVSNHFEGMRLSEVLKIVDNHGLRLDAASALCMLRQVAAALARLHECGDDISHGALNPERLVVSGSGRVIVTEYVLGAGLEALAVSRQQVWQDYRVALPSAAAPARLDHAADIFQLGYIGLTLLSGRSLFERQYPAPFAERLQAAQEIQVQGRPQELHPALRGWLARALWLETVPFTSAAEAQSALEEAIATAGLAAAPDVVVELLERCFGASPESRPESAGDAGPAAAPALPIDTRVDTLVLPTSPFAQLGSSNAIAAPSPIESLLVPTSQVETTAHGAGVPGLDASAVSSLLVDAQTAARSDATFAGPTYVAEPPRTEAPVPVEEAADEAPEPVAEATTVAPPELPAAKAWTPQTAAERSRPEMPRPEAPRPEAPRVEAPRAEAARVETSALSRYAEPADTGRAAVAGAAASPSVRKPYLIALGMAVVMVGVFEVVIRYFNPFDTTPAKAITASELPANNGTLSIDSTPKAKVFIDEAARGETPLRLELPAGQHHVRLEAEGAGRAFQINVIGGKEISQLVELTRQVVTGTIEVRSEPAGARVLIDGRSVGVSPVTVPDVKPGPHGVVVEGANGSVRQVVQVAAGATASILVPLNAATNAPTGGWVSIDAPDELQVYEGGRLLGTSRSERIMVSVGSHDLELRHEAAGFTTTRSVQVQGGKVSKISVQLPDGNLSLNAVPWAEVWVDGQRIGETPVGNVAVRVGTHEVVFRHPQHGEVRQTVVVKAGESGRVTVNMAK